MPFESVYEYNSASIGDARKKEEISREYREIIIIRRCDDIECNTDEKRKESIANHCLYCH